MTLANEVINSYSRVRKHVGEIVRALSGISLRFTANELSRRAPSTAVYWEGDYSPSDFNRLITEMGIVGRVRTVGDGPWISADFEYNLDDRLTLTDNEDCVIHPMFHRKLNVQNEEGMIVLPFSGHGFDIGEPTLTTHLSG